MKKKILMTAFDFPPQWGGVATYSWELAQHLHEQGYDVHVITKKRADPIEADFRISSFSLPQSGLLSFPKLCFHLVQLLRQTEVDHIICTLWLPGALSVFLSQKFLRKKLPYSIVVHAMEIIESKETLRKRFREKLQSLKNKCFSEAQHCFCVSHFTRELLLSLVPINARKVHVINNGVNPKRFSLDSFEKNKNYPTLVSACRLVPNKGIDQMIKVMPEVIKEYPKAQYIILGDGPDKKRLQKLAATMGVDKHIQFKGKVSHDELKDFYKQAHLFVMLSRRQRHHVEGFGLVFLEAALCKTPSLGGNSGGIPDAIKDNVTGWLISPYDIKKIEDKLMEILKNPDSLQQFGEKAYQVTQTHRTWKQQIKQMMGIIGV